MMTSLWMLLDWLDQAAGLFDDFGRGGANGFDDALRRVLLDVHRLELGSSWTSRRGVQVRLAEVLLRLRPRSWLLRRLGRALPRRQTGGDIFGAFDFLLVPGAVEDFFVAALCRSSASARASVAARSGVAGLGLDMPPLGRKRMPPRRRREKFLFTHN